MTIPRADANHALAAIGNTSLLPDDPSQDLRGHAVIDRHGETIGHVSDLFIDERERKVRFLEVSAGGFLGFGARHALVPVDAVTKVSGKDVHIDQTREHVATSPAYDPKLVSNPPREYWEPFYGYYGLSPYWGVGYTYPHYPIYANGFGSRDRALRDKHD